MPAETLDLIPPLAKGAHTNKDGGVCFMEAVSLVTGEPWSDHPACACPVIGAFMRSWNDSLSDKDRDRLLRPFILKMGGTLAPELEQRRATMAADWLVRTHTPAWLRLAGLTAHADALASLPEMTDIAQCPSLMPVLIAAQKDAIAAGAAARAAAGAAARDAALATGWAAAWAVVEAATGAAAWAAAWATAWAAAEAAAEATAEAAAGAAAGAAAWATAEATAEAAAGAAAWTAAGDAAGNAAWAAAEAAAWDAALATGWAAAVATARAAARAAARDALAAIVSELQQSALLLVERMIEVSDV